MRGRDTTMLLPMRRCPSATNDKRCSLIPEAARSSEKDARGGGDRADIIEISVGKIASLARPSEEGIARSAGKTQKLETANQRPKSRECGDAWATAIRVKAVTTRPPNRKMPARQKWSWMTGKIAGKMIEAIEHAKIAGTRSSRIRGDIGCCVSVRRDSGDMGAVWHRQVVGTAFSCFRTAAVSSRQKRD